MSASHSRSLVRLIATSPSFSVPFSLFGFRKRHFRLLQALDYKYATNEWFPNNSLGGSGP